MLGLVRVGHDFSESERVVGDVELLKAGLLGHKALLRLYLEVLRIGVLILIGSPDANRCLYERSPTSFLFKRSLLILLQLVLMRKSMHAIYLVIFAVL